MTDNIPSTVVRKNVETIYALHKARKAVTFWKPTEPPRVFYQNVLPKENYLWKHNSDYFLFCIVTGCDILNLHRACLFSLQLNGGVFLIMTILSMVVLVLPMMYVEVFLGTYTRLPNSQQYRMAPIFFGFCVLVSIASSLAYIEKSHTSSIPLNFAMTLMVKTIEDCPKEECYDIRRDGPLSMNCTSGDMALLCEGKEIRYRSLYFYWKEFESTEGRWDALCCILLTWTVVTVLGILGIRVMGVMLRWTFAIYVVMQIVIVSLVMISTGDIEGVSSLFVFKLDHFDPVFCFITVAWFTKNAGLIAPSGYMTFAVYKRPSKMSIVLECVLIVGCKFLLNLFYLMKYHMAAAVLVSEMKILSPEPLVIDGAAFICTLIPEFLNYRECPVLFKVAYLVTTWMLEVATLAIFFHMDIMNMFHFIPRLMNYDRLFRVCWAFLHCGITMLLVFKFVVKQFAFLGISDKAIFLQMCCLIIEAIMLFYCYGVARIRDDIHFYSNRKSMKFWSILWYIYPVISIMFHVLLFIDVGSAVYIPLGSTALYLFICFCGSFIYIMLNYKKMKRLRHLFKPQFHWGPPLSSMRSLRKRFSPNSMIRSEPRKKERVNFRPNSLKQNRENILRRKKLPGLVFIDSYTRIHPGKHW